MKDIQVVFFLLGTCGLINGILGYHLGTMIYLEALVANMYGIITILLGVVQK